MKITDLKDDSWFMIAMELKNGGNPNPDLIIAALMRGEDKVPEIAQTYIARLLKGEIDRRGRPRKNAQYETLNDLLLVVATDGRAGFAIES
jgi:hypothetical protein